MGLFDFFLSEDKKISKHQRRLTNRDAQAEDREASAVWLSDLGSPKALMALLSRFDVKLTHQLNDKTEKEFLFGILAKHGDSLDRPLRAHLKKCKQFAWPLRLLQTVQNEEAVLSVVYELLQHELEKDNFKPAKKTGLLLWLAERQHDNAIAASVPFLEDFDEGVRYAASEVLIAQQTDAAREPLLSVLTNPEEDSNRLKVRISEVFVGRRWPVDGHEIVDDNLPDTFVVRDGRIVQSA